VKGEFYKMAYESWDEGTDELTLEQEAAYLRLCHQMYRRKGPIANQEATLCRLWRTHKNKARAILQALIDKNKVEVTEAGTITNPRVMQEIAARFSGPKSKGGTGDTRRTPKGHPADTQPTPVGHPADTGGTPEGPFSAKPLENNDLPRVEKRREEENREEKSREEKTLGTGETLTPEDIARIEAVAAAGAGIVVSQIPVIEDPIDADEPPVETAEPVVHLTQLAGSGARFADSEYAYRVGKFRISHTDLAKLKASYPYADVDALCQNASTFAEEKWGVRWWSALNSWLLKENKAAKAEADSRKARVEVEVAVAGKPVRSRFQLDTGR
jgi:uncharacterized protein YdaU (DUF1376 family)